MTMRVIVQVAACFALLAGGLGSPAERLPRSIMSASDGRIVSGDSAGPFQYPWQAALLTVEDRFFCGASIIDAQWILTAGHCVDPFNAFKVIVGSLTVPSGSESTRKTFTTTDRYLHPQYDMVYLDNDIGLLKLPERISFNNMIKKIDLPTYSLASADLVGQVVYTSGWGKTTDDSVTASPVLRSTNLTVVANAQCEKVYGNTMIGTKLCLYDADGHSVCNGDSGGALVMEMTEGQFVQIGITSFVSDEGCEVKFPQGFTRVSSFLEYIEETTDIAISD